MAVFNIYVLDSMKMVFVMMINYDDDIGDDDDVYDDLAVMTDAKMLAMITVMMMLVMNTTVMTSFIASFIQDIG